MTVIHFNKKPLSLSISMESIYNNSETTLKLRQNIHIFRLFMAEFFGTGMLVLISCGACVSTNKLNDNLLISAFCFGLLVFCIAAAFGDISGGHLNPAVTIGLLVNGKISAFNSVLYISAQLTGAIGGAGMLAFMLPNGSNELCPTTVTQHITVEQAICVELVISFMLVLVVCCVSHNKTIVGPLAIGLAVTVNHLFAIPLTSASMNPARSLGPALITFSWTNHYVYWIGPISGGILAGLVHRCIFENKSDDDNNS